MSVSLKPYSFLFDNLPNLMLVMCCQIYALYQLSSCVSFFLLPPSHIYDEFVVDSICVEPVNIWLICCENIADVRFLLDYGAGGVWVYENVSAPLKCVKESRAEMIDFLKWYHWLE